MGLFGKRGERIPSQRACAENTKVLGEILVQYPGMFKGKEMVAGADVDRPSQAMNCHAVYNRAGEMACDFVQCPLQDKDVAELPQADDLEATA
ncbi:hypothetical protein BH09PAT4_BH09PAT4_07200 [soil metagenome]